MSYWNKIKAKSQFFNQILITDHSDKITELAFIFHIVVIIWPILPHGRSYPTIPYVLQTLTWAPDFMFGLSLETTD